ncbi:hypothetical protein BC830DRAFT_1109996 [Chytriomyces sp. MP71]|nr:hypothetical protein BC830DRAFT_1109996 [Chytriomyces sp. MP71]
MAAKCLCTVSGLFQQNYFQTTMSESGASSKGLRGRKLACDEPENRRLAMNRVNGRNFRERKARERQDMEQQLKEFSEVLQAKNIETATLKSTIKMLEDDNMRLVESLRKLQPSLRLDGAMGAETMPMPMPTCQACDAERAKAQFHKDYAAALDSALSTLKSECDQLKRTIADVQNLSWINSLVTPSNFPFGLDPFTPLSTTSFTVTEIPVSTEYDFAVGDAMALDLGVVHKSPSFEEMLWLDVTSTPPPNSEQRDQSAEAIYGPMRIEFARFFLKSIHSLADPFASKHADAFIDSIIQSSKASNKHRIHKFFTRAIKALHLMFDECATPAEQMSIVETFFSIDTLNKPALEHIMNRIVDFQPVARQTSAVGGYTIPPHAMGLNASLKKIPALSGCYELIDEFCLLVSAPKETPDVLVGTGITIMQLLRSKCTLPQDKVKVLEAMNQFWRENHGLLSGRMDQTIRELDALELE